VAETRDSGVAFCDRLVERFPELRGLLADHRQYHGETLPHVLMGNVTRWAVGEYHDGRREAIAGLADWLEAEYPSASSYVEDLIDDSFLENLPWPPHPEAAAIAQLLGPRLKQSLQDMQKWR